mgnify:CR=1 FL=1
MKLNLNTNRDFFDVFQDLAESGHVKTRANCGGYVPEVYNIMEGDFQDDVPFILEYALEEGSPVVDVGAGTGRITLPLAREGLKVYALDSDPDMLGQLAQATAKAQELEGEVLPILGDMRDFILPEPAAMALCSVNTFLYLGSVDQQRRALSAIRRNLKPGGLLWLDVETRKPSPVSQEPCLVTKTDPATGALVFYCVQGIDDNFLGTSQMNDFTMVLGRSAQPELYVQSWTYGWISPKEAEMLLSVEGFKLEAMLGDYTGREANELSNQLILLARKIQ